MNNPIHCRSPEIDEARKSMPTLKDTLSRFEVLLVGGGLESRGRIGAMLGRHFRTHAVADANSALAAIRVHRPDAVVTLAAKPDAEALALLRMDPALLDVPMILLSTKDDIERRFDGSDFDFDDYIDQSVSERELIARVQATLNGSRMRARRNQRYRFLIGLDDATRSLIRADEITLTVATLVGKHLGANRCAYADVEEDQDTFNLTGNYSDGVPGIVGRYRFAQFGSECLRLMRAGLPFTVTDTLTDPRTVAVADAYRQTLIHSVICVPLMKSGRLVSAMAVHQATPREWRSDEIELLRVAANRCWESIERTRITRELHDNETRYRKLVETISAVVWRTDHDGSASVENPSWEAFTGQTFDQFKGFGWVEAVHPDDRDVMFQAWRVATKSLKPFEGSYRLRRHDGEYRDMTARGALLWTADGKRQEWIGNCLDVTEAKRADEALRDSAARLQFALESAQVGDWDLDMVTGRARRSLRHDQCFGYDRPVDEWNFDIFIRHVHPDDRERVEKGFRKVTSDLQDWHFECRVVWPDGSVHWIAVHGSIYHCVDGKPTHMLGIVFDITERKLGEEKLKDADRRKDEFLAMLAHELRNPLAPIGAAADLLSLVRIDEERVRQTSAVISRQVRHMTGLVDDLLDVSRVTRGLVVLDKVTLDAKRIVSDAVEQVRPLIEARRHHLAVHMPPESAFVYGDQKRLVQVITNLLNNAAKYTQEGGNIILRLEVQKDRMILSVTDDGIGMAPELVERAFELFAQAERTSDRSQGGLGLGLALVKSLVELHGGHVTARSGGLGKGSEFAVLLPRVAKARTYATASNGPPVRIPAKGLRLMVVDDNEDAASMLAMFLEAAGHEVMVEHDPARSLELARREMPDVCLLDIGLPGMDGNELARRLRLQPETSKAILIAVTGYGQEQDRGSAAAAGFDHHFVKPVDAAALAALLAGISDR